MTEKIYVGIDWATQSHTVVVLDGSGQRLGKREVEANGEGLEAMVLWLLDLAGGDAGRLQVAIETPHGSVVEALMRRGVAVYAINPKQADRFRDRHTVAGAKDDQLDALVLGDSLRTDAKAFRRVKPSPATVVQLREFSRHHTDLTMEKVRLELQLRDNLLRYFPQFLKLGDLDTDWILTLIRNIGTPQEAARSRAKTIVHNTLREQRVRKFTEAQVIDVLRERPVPTAPGVAEAARSLVLKLLPRLNLVRTQLKDLKREMDSLLESHQDETPGEQREHRDVEIILSLPGAGTFTAATVLSEAYEALMARDYQGLRTRGGVAPVTKQTGLQRSHPKHRGPKPQVSQRRACNKQLRLALFYLATGAVRQGGYAHWLYKAAKQRGHTHGHALRVVGDRLLKVLVSMLKFNQKFQEDRWGARQMISLDAA